MNPLKIEGIAKLSISQYLFEGLAAGKLSSLKRSKNHIMRIAAFSGKVKDFRLYLLALRTWLNFERIREEAFCKCTSPSVK